MVGVEELPRGRGFRRPVRATRKMFCVTGRRNPLKRLNPAKAIQANPSLFLGCVWLGSGWALPGLDKFGGGLAKGDKAERSIFVTQPFDIASPSSLAHQLPDQLLDAGLDPPRPQPLCGDDRHHVAIGALKVVIDNHVLVIAPASDLLPGGLEPRADRGGRVLRPPLEPRAQFAAATAARRRC